jgi:hypothetical protein
VPIELIVPRRNVLVVRERMPGARGIEHRLDDLFVAGAATKIRAADRWTLRAAI